MEVTVTRTWLLFLTTLLIFVSSGRSQCDYDFQGNVLLLNCPMHTPNSTVTWSRTVDGQPWIVSFCAPATDFCYNHYPNYYRATTSIVNGMYNVLLTVQVRTQDEHAMWECTDPKHDTPMYVCNMTKILESTTQTTAPLYFTTILNDQSETNSVISTSFVSSVQEINQTPIESTFALTTMEKSTTASWQSAHLTIPLYSTGTYSNLITTSIPFTTETNIELSLASASSVQEKNSTPVDSLSAKTTVMKTSTTSLQTSSYMSSVHENNSRSLKSTSELLEENSITHMQASISTLVAQGNNLTPVLESTSDLIPLEKSSIIPTQISLSTALIHESNPTPTESTSTLLSVEESSTAPPVQTSAPAEEEKNEQLASDADVKQLKTVVIAIGSVLGGVVFLAIGFWVYKKRKHVPSKTRQDRNGVLNDVHPSPLNSSPTNERVRDSSAEGNVYETIPEEYDDTKYEEIDMYYSQRDPYLHPVDPDGHYKTPKPDPKNTRESSCYVNEFGFVSERPQAFLTFAENDNYEVPSNLRNSNASNYFDYRQGPNPTRAQTTPDTAMVENADQNGKLNQESNLGVVPYVYYNPAHYDDF